MNYWEATNGMAQGDSFTVLLLNVLMAIMVRILGVLTPVVDVDLFVDDTGIKAPAADLPSLMKASEIMDCFVKLCGQKNNVRYGEPTWTPGSSSRKPFRKPHEPSPLVFGR